MYVHCMDDARLNTYLVFFLHTVVHFRLSYYNTLYTKMYKKLHNSIYINIARLDSKKWL